VKFCGGCGAPHVPGDQFCQQCGRAYATDEPTAASQEIPAAQWAEPADEPFPDWAPFAAGVAVFVAPFISLIVSLVMRSSEQRPSRRSFLKTWAIASGVWLCTGFLIVILAFSAMGSGSGVLGGGGCKGGPDPFNPPTYQSPDGKHWTAIVPCLNGGSKTRPATKSEAKWLNH
jgi:hypothetical protein